MKKRLDTYLEEQGLASSRARARDLIKRGLVQIGGKQETKPARTVMPGMVVTLADVRAASYVSRAAEKLVSGLDQFEFDPSNLVAIDCGASTGGFTEVLLRRGASKVFAVDTGHDQLHPALRDDPRVMSLEGTDIRSIDTSLVPEPVGAVVSDLSFISTTKALGTALALAEPGAFAVILVKPQFEVGRDRIGKGGIVRDEAAIEWAKDHVSGFVEHQPGWKIKGLGRSPISGGSGNQEFLLGAVKG